MRKKDIRNNKIRNFVNLFTALMFTLLTSYQIYLLVQISQNRTGRILGIISFALITIATFFALVPRKGFSIMRTVLLIAGLSLNIIIKIFNASAMFGMLDFAYTPTVLNCAVYVLSQAAELLLLLYYLVFRHNKKLSRMRKLACVAMSAVVLLYLSCLIMEIVLMIRYGWNIDLSLKYTIASRFLYFFGFAGIAVSFMLPVPQSQGGIPAAMIRQTSREDEILFSVPDNERAKVEVMKKPQSSEADTDFVL